MSEEIKEEMTMVSVPRSVHTKIKALAKQDKRSIRSYLEVLIDAQLLKGVKK